MKSATARKPLSGPPDPPCQTKPQSPNYGDGRLDLGPEWNRRSFVNKPFLQTTIGHDNGDPDVHLTKNPEQVHVFTWVDPNWKNPDYYTDAYDDGYRLVQRAEWTNHRYEWDAEGHIRYQGQLLMAIPKEQYDALMAERGPGPQPDPMAGVAELAARSGAFVEDETPRPALRRR